MQQRLFGKGILYHCLFLIAIKSSVSKEQQRSKKTNQCAKISFFIQYQYETTQLFRLRRNDPS